MDKASAYGAGDCRFESYRDHLCPLSDKARGKQPRTQVLVSAGGPSVFSVPQLVCPDQFTAQRGSRVDLTDRDSNLAEQLGRSRGPMDKASAYGAGDCRFESCRGHVVNKYKVVCSGQAGPDEITVHPKGKSIRAGGP